MVTCIGIDFDNTLGHFIHGSRDFFNIFHRRQVPKEKLESAYHETVRALGFAFPQFVSFLAAAVGGLPNREVLELEFEEWLARELVAYPDSIPACTLWHRCHIPICVLTAGEEQYQRRKIELLHIPCDSIIVVPHANEKAKAIPLLLEQFGPQIEMIDDKTGELDAIRDAGFTANEVVTVHINRSDSPYRTQVGKFKHREISNLVDALPEFAQR